MGVGVAKKQTPVVGGDGCFSSSSLVGRLLLLEGVWYWSLLVTAAAGSLPQARVTLGFGGSVGRQN